MLTRALSALGYAHSQGLVHGALNPDRLIVQPRSHNALIVGWSSAAYRPATTGERIKPPFGEFSAPEVRDAAEIGPWSDIYSLGKLMIWLLGGNHVTNEFPPGIEPPLQRFILSLVTESYLARPADAWALHEQHNRIKDRLWKRKYLHFDMS
jgi:serine/threonine protein kinase